MSMAADLVRGCADARTEASLVGFGRFCAFTKGILK
jgi:hypothetical protein